MTAQILKPHPRQQKPLMLPKSNNKAIPNDGLRGLKENWRTDMMSGFVVFMIALPLSLGIAMASGAPPLAGIISAIVGGIIVSLAGGSHLSINGPAAGLAIVIICSVERLGGGLSGYRATLAAIVTSGVLLVVFGSLRAGKLGKLFPASVVHGMLAAIGIMIAAKQIPYLLGVLPKSREPLELLASVPSMLPCSNPVIVVISSVSILLLLLHSNIKNSAIKRIPAPVIVVFVATLLGLFLGLDRAHEYKFLESCYRVEPSHSLVNLPSNLSQSLIAPDFSHWQNYGFWLSVVSIFLVQALESLLSCNAVSRLDPFRRKSSLSRDVAAVGIGTVISGMIGGLPVITEIVRSTANVANGARTRWSNFFHGLFILAALIFATALLNKIPLAALAALLLFTGYKLASPRIFKEVHSIGIEQTIVFVTTLVAVLATDLLIGVFIGIGVKLCLHVAKGASVLDLFKTKVACVAQEDGSIDVGVAGILAFSNFLCLSSKLDGLPKGHAIRVDLSNVRLIDHSVMEHLHHFAESYAETGGSVNIVGLEEHASSSPHPLAARRLPGRVLQCNFANFL